MVAESVLVRHQLLILNRGHMTLNSVGRDAMVAPNKVARQSDGLRTYLKTLRAQEQRSDLRDGSPV